MNQSKLKVLILDGDSEFSRWAAATLLKTQGAEVRTFTTDADAFQMLRKFRADIALIDIGMRQVGGIEFLHRLRDTANSPNADLPVMLTAQRADADILRHACKIGINSFTMKPTQEDRFLRRLQDTLANPKRFIITSDYFGPTRRRGLASASETNRRRQDDQQELSILAAPPPTATTPSEPVSPQ